MISMCVYVHIFFSKKYIYIRTYIIFYYLTCGLTNDLLVKPVTKWPGS